MVMLSKLNHPGSVNFGWRFFVPCLAILMILLSGLPSWAAEEVAGRAYVLDGDTLIIKRQHIRLYAVDAPEKSQTCQQEGQQVLCGQVATDMLRQKIGRRSVTCVSVSPRDKYGRMIARCSVHGDDLGRYMVQSGFALAYRHYGSDYIPDEEQAKKALRGLWSGQFEAPWIWRHKHHN